MAKAKMLVMRPMSRSSPSFWRGTMMQPSTPRSGTKMRMERSGKPCIVSSLDRPEVTIGQHGEGADEHGHCVGAHVPVLGLTEDAAGAAGKTGDTVDGAVHDAEVKRSEERRQPGPGMGDDGLVELVDVPLVTQPAVGGAQRIGERRRIGNTG